MRILFAILIAFTISMSPIISKPAHAVVVETAAAKHVLKSLSERIQKVISEAEAAGNRLIANAARRLLDVINAWEKSNTNLINHAFDKIENERAQILRDIDKTLSRIEKSGEVAFYELNLLSVQIASMLKDMPGANHEPQVFYHQPRALLPVGEEIIPIMVFGPHIGGAVRTVTHDGKALEFDKVNNNRVLVKLPRTKLSFKEKSQYTKLIFTIDKHVSSFWNPFSWWGEKLVERELSLWILPQKLGTVNLQINTETEVWDKMRRVVRVHTSGRDQAVNFPVTLSDGDKTLGWVLDIVTLQSWIDNGTNWFVYRGGYASRPNGLVRNTMTDQGFTFQNQHGHRRQWNNHRRGTDAHVDVTVPMMKKRLKKSSQRKEKNMNWSKDLVFKLPSNTSSYEIALNLFNGREYKLSSKVAAPYKLISSTYGKDQIHLRPIPPRDF